MFGNKTEFSSMLADELTLDLDAPQFAFDAGDTTRSPALFAQRISAMAHELKGALPAEVEESLRVVLNFFVNADNFIKIKELPEAVRHKKEKAAKVLLDAFTKDANNVNHLLSILIYAGAIHGVAAAAITPAGGATMAALAWAAVGFQGVALTRASLNAVSPSRRFKNSWVRYKKIQKKIDSLYKELAALNQDTQRKQIEAIQRDIQDWVKKQEILKFKAIATAQIDNMKALEKNKKPRVSKKLKEKFIASVEISNATRESTLNPTVFKNLLSQNQPSEEMKRLENERRKDRRDKIIKRSVRTFGYSLLAVGSTLMVIAPFCGGYGTPVVFAIGLAFTALGGAVLGGQYLITKLVNTVAKAHTFKQEKTAWLQEQKIQNFQLKNIPINKDLSRWQKIKFNEKRTEKYYESQRFKYYLSFQQQKNEKNTLLTEDDWYKYLNQLPHKERSQLLNSTVKTVIENRIIRSVLKPEVNSNLLEQVSEKEKKNIINRACRHQLRVDMTQNLKAKSLNTYTSLKATPAEAVALANAGLSHMGLFNNHYSRPEKSLVEEKERTVPFKGIR